MKNSSTLMSEGPIAKTIILFALPLFLGNLFQQLYNTADSLIVGNFLGSEALAAVSSSGNLIFLMVGFFNGISIGAGVVISRYFGAKDTENMRKAIHTTVALGLVSGIVLTVVGVILAPLLLEWMDTPVSVMPQSVSYFQIYFAGSLGLVMYNIFVGILQAVGDSKHPLYYLIFSSVINIVLDLLFVGVFHWGVGSAALATILSQFASALLCFALLLRVKEDYRICIKEIRFDREMLVSVIRYGFPSGLQNSIIAIANVVVQSNINSFGELAMAGCGAFSKIEGFAFLPVTCFTMALTTFVGQNLGAKEYERTKKGARFGIVCALVIAEIIGLFLVATAPWLMAAFDPNPDVIAYGVGRAYVASPFFFLCAYTHCVAAILRGAGKPAVPMGVFLAFWCVIRVAILMIASKFIHTIDVVYWVYPITWTLSSIYFFFYMRKSDWVHGFSH